MQKRLLGHHVLTIMLIRWSNTSKKVGENCMSRFHKQETEWFSKFGNNVHHFTTSAVAGRRKFPCYLYQRADKFFPNTPENKTKLFKTYLFTSQVALENILIRVAITPSTNATHIRTVLIAGRQLRSDKLNLVRLSLCDWTVAVLHTSDQSSKVC